MTISLEKIFFAYIINNKRFLPVVEDYFFKNREIEFVYDIIKSYMTSGTGAELPSNKQILEMVQLKDVDNMITRELLKGMLSVNLDDYDEINFLLPRLNGWILSNRIKAGTVDIVDATRDIDNLIDFEDVVTSANKIKDIVNSMSNTNFIDDDDLGSDFDDPECHFQDNAANKVSTGYSTIDHILGGGFDRNTLNLLIGETNNGKSLWLNNLAVNTSLGGYNTLYITLEMTEKKVIKRMSSKMLKIPINEFDERSKDTAYIKSKLLSLDEVDSKSMGKNLFNKKRGKLITKFWSAGTVTVDTIDNYIAKIQDKRNIKIDMVVVDYITLIALSKEKAGEGLYMKGKLIAEGLRAIASKYNLVMLSASQIGKDSWGSSAEGITLAAISESKSLAESSDTIFGIIRSPEMKLNNLYRLKLLKQRDGDFSKSQVMFNLNVQYLSIEDDRFVDGI